MPIDCAKYPNNWHSEIRPKILKRDKDCCKFCGIKNHLWVIRGKWGDNEVYQDDKGNIYDANTSEKIGASYVGDVAIKGSKWIKIVLTVTHLNHETQDNSDENLAALCQRCYNRHDAKHRKKNRRKTAFGKGRE